jgi:restriction system-associated AAA family ATPase
VKLISLVMKAEFRSLPAGFNIRFQRSDQHDRALDFSPICLSGRNGSGKSNVLEALAAIFFHLECIYLEYRPAGLEYDPVDNPGGFRAEVAAPDAYSLEYLIVLNPDSAPAVQSKALPPLAHVRITKEIGRRPEVEWLNKPDGPIELTSKLDRREIRMLMPRYVVGYSSGKNEILSLPFLKMRFIHFDEYCERLTQGTPYGGVPEGRLLYIDEEYHQAVLLCHYLFPSAPVLSVFRDHIGLAGLRRFRVIIRKFHLLPIASQSFEDNSSSLTSQHSGLEITSGLSGHLEESGQTELGIIDKLIRCSTCYYEDFSPYDDGSSHDLYLDFWVTEATRAAFSAHFGVASTGTDDFAQAASALNLFHSLRSLLALNLYQVDVSTKLEMYNSASLYFNETVAVPASHDRIMRFKDFELQKSQLDRSIYGKSLSDGEHQLLHTVGLCLLFRHEPVLFLLDEPETHLNPDWRASYISIIRRALALHDQSRNITREIVLTSHSPFVISDIKQENVLIFKKDSRTNLVEYERPDFNTFGASSTLITTKIFGQSETIGDLSLNEISRLHDRLQEGEDPTSLIEEAGQRFGDSIEKVLFLNQAMNARE